MRKKLLILACNYPSNLEPLGGVFVKEQARILSENFSVSVLNPKIFGWRGAFRRLRQPMEANIDSDAAFVKRVRSFSALAFLSGGARKQLLSSSKKGYQEIIELFGKPDLIAGHFAVDSGWLASILAEENKIPYILHEHASQFCMYLHNAESASMAREAIRKAAAIVAVSPHLEREIKDFEPSAKTLVIGNYVDTELFCPENPTAISHPPVFFAAGHVTDQKGFSFLLNATAILLQRNVGDFRIVIGGGGPKLDDLKRLADKLGLTNIVNFLGPIQPDRVLENMRMAQCVVMPSLHESFCIVLAEAISCGKPVIATRCGGPEFFVDARNGYLANPGDPLDLAEKMLAILRKEKTFDPNSLHQSIHSRFGKEAFLSQISRVYNQFL